jgi:hypothetical protein
MNVKPAAYREPVSTGLKSLRAVTVEAIASPTVLPMGPKTSTVVGTSTARHNALRRRPTSGERGERSVGRSVGRAPAS